jgi:hypothetical protein
MSSQAEVAGYGGVRAEARFEDYVGLLCLEYKRKGNFMTLLDGIV